MCSHRALLAAMEKAFSWLLFEISCYFHGEEKCAIWVGLNEWCGSIGLGGLGLWDGRWLLQHHGVPESRADQPWAGRSCGCCRQPYACVERLGQPEPPCSNHEPLWSAALGPTVRYFQGHWIFGPTLGLCCVLKQTEMMLSCNGWALQVKIVSYCSISEDGLDPCVVVCLEGLALCLAQVSCARWVGLLETCTTKYPNI